MYELLTIKDVAKRWKKSEIVIRRLITDGILVPCRKIPGDIRFTPDHIAELEGIKLEKFSPIEKRKLEKELEQLKEENRQLKEIGLNMLSVSAKMANVINS